jgi:hypothetical protein
MPLNPAASAVEAIKNWRRCALENLDMLFLPVVQMLRYETSLGLQHAALNWGLNPWRESDKRHALRA